MSITKGLTGAAPTCSGTAPIFEDAATPVTPGRRSAVSSRSGLELFGGA